MLGLFLFLMLVGAALVWWQFMRARELARTAAALACREHGLILMDDTVVLDGVDFSRHEHGRRLGLRYKFDFALNGILNRGSSVLIIPRKPVTVVLDTENGRLIETVTISGR